MPPDIKKRVRKLYTEYAMKKIFLICAALLLAFPLLHAGDKKDDKDEDALVLLSPADVKGFYIPADMSFRRSMEVTPVDEKFINLRVKAGAFESEGKLFLNGNKVYMRKGKCGFFVYFRPGGEATVTGAGDRCRVSGIMGWSQALDGEFQRRSVVTEAEVAGLYQTSTDVFDGALKIDYSSKDGLTIYLRNVEKDGFRRTGSLYGKAKIAKDADYLVFDRPDCSVMISFTRDKKTSAVNAARVEFGSKPCFTKLTMAGEPDYAAVYNFVPDEEKIKEQKRIAKEEEKKRKAEEEKKKAAEQERQRQLEEESY